MTDEHRRQQRLHISRQAVALFRQRGVAATSGAEIATAAGVSERTLWRLFRTKESCVGPLLSATTEDFLEVLRVWPADVGLSEHLRAEYTFMADASRADIEAVLAVVRLGRDEPGLRAVRLLIQDGVEPTFAEMLARHSGRDAGDPDVRARAAAMNAVLRVVVDDLADLPDPELGTGDGDGPVAEHRLLLAEALRVITPVPRGAGSAAGSS